MKMIDDAGNVLAPDIKSKETLLQMEKYEPYVYASQYQQNPAPAGGGIFKKENFVILDEDPKILATFIIADTAETSKNYNDATVFTFFGLYKINDFNVETDVLALHVLDCLEIWVEPKDLEFTFKQFYSECLRHPVKPKFAAIEKKSSGSMLISFAKELRGIHIIEIERHAGSGSKTDRMLKAQPYINQKLISFTKDAKHAQKVIDHMVKITATESQRYDDIADTIADGIKLALIDKVISSYDMERKTDDVVRKMVTLNDRKNLLGKELWQSRSDIRMS